MAPSLLILISTAFLLPPPVADASVRRRSSFSLLVLLILFGRWWSSSSSGIGITHSLSLTVQSSSNGTWPTQLPSYCVYLYLNIRGCCFPTILFRREVGIGEERRPPPPPPFTTMSIVARITLERVYRYLCAGLEDLPPLFLQFSAATAVAAEKVKLSRTPTLKIKVLYTILKTGALFN